MVKLQSKRNHPLNLYIGGRERIVGAFGKLELADKDFKNNEKSLYADFMVVGTMDDSNSTVFLTVDSKKEGGK